MEDFSPTILIIIITSSLRMNHSVAKTSFLKLLSTKENPKVVSCYRRNYIQISANMSIRGFKNDSKLLKLQTSEYGYTTTRVIKYFKIEVLAAANNSNSKGVPIIIKNENKDIERNGKKKQEK